MDGTAITAFPNLTGSVHCNRLVETRKALRRAAPGDIIEVVGTHPTSKKEIPMAVEALGLELLSIEGTDTDWLILIRR